MITEEMINNELDKLLEIKKNPFKVLKGENGVESWILATLKNFELLDDLPEEFNNDYFWSEFVKMCDFNESGFPNKRIDEKYISKDIILKIAKKEERFTQFDEILKIYPNIADNDDFIKEIISSNLKFRGYLQIDSDERKIKFLTHHLTELTKHYLDNPDKLKDLNYGWNPFDCFQHYIDKLLTKYKDTLDIPSELFILLNKYFEFHLINNSSYNVNQFSKENLNFVNRQCLLFVNGHISKLSKLSDFVGNKDCLKLIEQTLESCGKDIVNSKYYSFIHDYINKSGRFKHDYVYNWYNHSDEKTEYSKDYFHRVCSYNIINFDFFPSQFASRTLLESSDLKKLFSDSFKTKSESEIKLLVNMLHILDSFLGGVENQESIVNDLIQILNFDDIKEHLKLNNIEHRQSGRLLLNTLVKKYPIDEFKAKVRDEIKKNYFWREDLNKILMLRANEITEEDIKEFVYLEVKTDLLKKAG